MLASYDETEPLSVREGGTTNRKYNNNININYNDNNNNNNNNNINDNNENQNIKTMDVIMAKLGIAMGICFFLFVFFLTF